MLHIYLHVVQYSKMFESIFSLLLLKFKLNAFVINKTSETSGAPLIDHHSGSLPPHYCPLLRLRTSVLPSPNKVPGFSRRLDLWTLE